MLVAGTLQFGRADQAMGSEQRMILGKGLERLSQFQPHDTQRPFQMLGSRREVVKGPALVLKLKPDFGMAHGQAQELLRDVGHFRVGAAQEFATGGNVKEQITHAHLSACRRADLTHLPQYPTVDDQPRSGRGLALPGHQFKATHRGDTR